MKGLDVKYLIALGKLDGVGSKKAFTVGEYVKDNNVEINSIFDLIPVLSACKIKQRGTKEPFGKEELSAAMGSAENIIRRNDLMGIGVIGYYDEVYPQILRETINEEGKLDPPLVLYYKGDISLLQEPGLAIIGTREITPGGEKAGMYLSQEFAKRGLCIVSGLAIGCDTCGHRGALAVGGKTVAFLAHGLDMVYPPENEGLAKEIVEKGGLLVSEYPAGTQLNRYFLVARDRLQAGLAKATLVIQTGVSGGTMHAANTTLRANKPLYVVSYNDEETRNHEKTKGNDSLAKKGAKYIKGNDDLDKIADTIKQVQKSQTTLF